MFEKMDSKLFPLATAPILGQTPSLMRNIHVSLAAIILYPSQIIIFTQSKDHIMTTNTTQHTPMIHGYLTVTSATLMLDGGAEVRYIQAC
ncbi:MAG: hypothetical protein ACI9D5_001919 [Candidatus Endobugula sp.]|jgi:hypothetical protein